MVVLEDDACKFHLDVNVQDVVQLKPNCYRLFMMVREYSGGALFSNCDALTWKPILQAALDVTDKLQKLLQRHGLEDGAQLVTRAAMAGCPVLRHISLAHPYIVTQEVGADVVPPEAFCSIVHIVMDLGSTPPSMRKRARRTSS